MTMKRLYPLSLLIGLLISGCAGTSHRPGEMNADGAKEWIHGMNKEEAPELIGTWKLVSFQIQGIRGTFLPIVLSANLNQ